MTATQQNKKGEKMESSAGTRTASEALAGVTASGKKPEFVILSVRQAREDRDLGSEEEKTIVKITVRLKLNGKQVCVIARNPQSARVTSENIGQLDLLERAFQRAIVKRWPRLAIPMAEVKRTLYCAHTIKYPAERQVEVVMRLREANKEICEHLKGADTLKLNVAVLGRVYRWATWRMLNRLRGLDHVRQNGGRTTKRRSKGGKLVRQSTSKAPAQL